MNFGLLKFGDSLPHQQQSTSVYISANLVWNIVIGNSPEFSGMSKPHYDARYMEGFPDRLK